MPIDMHKIIISAEKTPTGQHMRRHNAPTIDEVSIVMVDDQFLPRDIISIFIKISCLCVDLWIR